MLRNSYLHNNKVLKKERNVAIIVYITTPMFSNETTYSRALFYTF